MPGWSHNQPLFQIMQHGQYVEDFLKHHRPESLACMKNSILQMTVTEFTDSSTEIPNIVMFQNNDIPGDVLTETGI